MKLKDNSIICMMILTWIFIAMGVLGAEAEISKIEKQVKELCYVEKYDIQQIYLMAELRDAEVDARLYEIEQTNRIQDIRLDQHREEITELDEMFVDLLNQQEHLEEYCRSLPDNALGLTLSDQDIRDIAALVYLEAGNQSYACKKAIASVIFNRMMRYSLTASECIYQRTNGGDRVFSPAYRVPFTNPSASCIMAVREVLEDGCTLPIRVTAFRNNHYHTDFGSPYCNIGNVYFSSV